MRYSEKPISSHDKEKAKVESDVAAFLANGGQIEQLSDDATGLDEQGRTKTKLRQLKISQDSGAKAGRLSRKGLARSKS